jgi:hypothetical protein
MSIPRKCSTHEILTRNIFTYPVPRHPTFFLYICAQAFLSLYWTSGVWSPWARILHSHMYIFTCALLLRRNMFNVVVSDATLLAVQLDKPNGGWSGCIWA